MNQIPTRRNEVSQKLGLVIPRVWRLPITLLIRADELRIGQHVALHSLLDLRFRRASWIKRGIQRVELVELTVAANRRARTTIP